MDELQDARNKKYTPSTWESLHRRSADESATMSATCFQLIGFFHEHGHDDSEPLVAALATVFLDCVCQAVAVIEHVLRPLQTLLLIVRQRAASYVQWSQEMHEPLS